MKGGTSHHSISEIQKPRPLEPEYHPAWESSASVKKWYEALCLFLLAQWPRDIIKALSLRIWGGVLKNHGSGVPGGTVVKNLPANAGDTRSIPGSGEPLEEGMATHSSILARRIPWTEEPGGLQSIGLHRGGHDWSDFTSMYTPRNWNYLFWKRRKARSDLIVEYCSRLRRWMKIGKEARVGDSDSWASINITRDKPSWTHSTSLFSSKKNIDGSGMNPCPFTDICVCLFRHHWSFTIALSLFQALTPCGNLFKSHLLQPKSTQSM